MNWKKVGNDYYLKGKYGICRLRENTPRHRGKSLLGYDTWILPTYWTEYKSNFSDGYKLLNSEPSSTALLPFQTAENMVRKLEKEVDNKLNNQAHG